MTALTLYPVMAVATSTLSSASNCATATGGGSADTTTLIGTATAWGQLYALGTSGAWPSLGSIGSPDGNGWLWDVTTLEGQLILAGTWTPTVTLAVSSGSLTNVTLTMRAYTRSSSGVYTAIGTWTLTSQSVSGTVAAYAFGGGSFSATTFGTGDKLYLDLWAGVGNNYASSGVTWKLHGSTTSGQGTTAWQVVTPGYQPAVTTSTRTVTPVSAALLSTSVRTIASATAALSEVGVRTVTPVNAAVGPPMRSITGVSAALLATRARSMVGVNAATYWTAARTVGSVSAAFSATLVRTALASATLSGVAVLSAVSYGAVIRAADLNQLVVILQRPVGSHAAGKYFLTGAASMTGGVLGAYVASLSRGVTPTGSVAIDTGDWPPTGCASPTADLLSASGFRVSTTAGAPALGVTVGGNYNITY